MDSSKKKHFRETSPADETSGPRDMDLELALEMTARERVNRLYQSPGGPLIGLLRETCAERGMTLKEMAEELGVTYGYLAHLTTGFRDISVISTSFAKACSVYLGIPLIAVRVLAGQITAEDFISPQLSRKELLRRGIRKVMDDPESRHLVTPELWDADLKVQEAFLTLYNDLSGSDLFGYEQIPEAIRWLQWTVIVHDENKQRAQDDAEDSDT
jgi:transcriptional regulator with XRE-family HTH domain